VRSSLRNGLIAAGAWFGVWILLGAGLGDKTILQATMEALPGAIAFAVVYGYLELRRGD
jgi:hypothetical protein